MTKSYTEKYGKPQGNELVYGADIIRRVDTFEFHTIDRFMSSKDAQTTYAEWMKENGCSPFNEQWYYGFDNF